MPVPRFQLPEIVEKDHDPDPFPPERGAGMPSRFSPMAIARALRPRSYSVKIRRTIAASDGSITRSPVV
ncbi:MAG: hypothetical protein A3D16_00450 [Rhodobacterales bacterium RIFCSPHIGHO2_02_FULL_62_130]|nr:MAG: hypothetical protein A3D16_00450 [Rhodobacterales bacterium RIFCSPHIGHO2_02_FULL_62_130]OHC57565.1 MAG: hypothetical protein A3E48_22535 [Rhodobacterales bacterium RIFCSPHIGHO2_12_FULL_62_75]